MAERVYRVRGRMADVLSKLREGGGRIVHRFGDTVVVSDDAIDKLPTSERSLFDPTPDVPLGAIADDVSDDEINHLAVKLRKSPKFIARKKNRSNEDRDWNEILGPCE
ncbi:MAG: hypothetical protein HUU55_01315 [Myxococcales bacterium]|nr:hypothetical protein [Myxococcales bacterium]